MSYPVGNPASGIYNIWNSGSFTPDQIVSTIRDNQTAVNRASLMNSVGYHISLIENFVNTNYLSRSNYPIGSGWIQNIFSSNITTGNVTSSGNISLYNGSNQNITVANQSTSTHSIIYSDYIYTSKHDNKTGDTYSTTIAPGVFYVCGQDYEGCMVSGSHLTFDTSTYATINFNSNAFVNSEDNIFSFVNTAVRVCGTGGMYTEVTPNTLSTNASCGMFINASKFKLTSRTIDLRGGVVQATAIGSVSSYVDDTYLSNATIQSSLRFGSSPEKILMSSDQLSLFGNTTIPITLSGNTYAYDQIPPDVVTAILGNRLISAQFVLVGGDGTDYDYVPSSNYIIATNGSDSSVGITVSGSFASMRHTTETYVAFHYIYQI